MASTYSNACCETPVPHNVADYQAQGEWLDILGEKVYVVGDKAANRAIVWVFDIFGYSPQTLRGADVVAANLLSSSKGPVTVLIPDWFDGTVADKAWVPPVTDDQAAKLGNFIKTKAAPELVVPRVLKFAEALKQHQTILPNIQNLGIFGFCWGGKLASIACQKSSDGVFAVAVQTSPSKADPEEARNISVPMALILSKDEDLPTMKRFYDNIPTPYKLLERFDDQIHGFMSGRGDLSDPGVKAEVERGYNQAVEFFDKYL
ncbi:hypothetical protein TSTA_062760 [Talaromyces stipitatus ATCC 10500]|uniref:Dienelactone hydrolase domain-containing protein n=1 Tax=Talaromyces stipitatus (strain ATCC 10500 / CBS 375.48 / QM 6759 / NRRL 1006) TaxID=441959 RepID=B8LXX4_TALSN|nr:uncharacterized protein TSTA_062760 [Talaromyces stipitatus ATCC 10500]EED22789.1 hypothetical protein TSTA_062760 [Talaromyces stipitatus ATCC 10500]